MSWQEGLPLRPDPMQQKQLNDHNGRYGLFERPSLPISHAQGCWLKASGGIACSEQVSWQEGLPLRPDPMQQKQPNDHNGRYG